mmetsp:Transcript_37023/g.37682  ORF Transcript_37023/g.37682 Transcript_37023/m.37682 type:complete len:535 (+) Transcript_37023:72-1676(+)
MWRLILLTSILNPTVTADEQPFIWGAATAAYQIEGAVGVDGGGLNIWDSFSRIPNKTQNQTADIADGSYYYYEKDIELLKNMGFSAYRFSIAWQRIFPAGKGEINQAGVDHYNHMIDAIIAAGLIPFVTLYHWDLPQTLHDEYGGWLSEKIIPDFTRFADICFQNYGDRVKHWITLNEPLTFTVEGYSSGIFAPGHCSDRTKCSTGDSTTEPYIVTHNALLAHSEVVKLYRSKYKAQSGQIGITLNMEWGEPYRHTAEDEAAAERWREFSFAWFMDPIVFGSYPECMRERVGERLPEFTKEQSEQIKGSWDFFGVNHYATWYFEHKDFSPSSSYGEDIGVRKTEYDPNGRIIGPVAASPWLHVVPSGMYKLLKWIDKRYDSPLIYITENGCDVPNENNMKLEEAIKDQFRIDYYKGYLSAVARAIEEGVNVRGYFAWSLLDNFEWADGFSMRFGLHYVDYTSPDLTRTPKDSAYWFNKFASANPMFARDETTRHQMYQELSVQDDERDDWLTGLEDAIIKTDGAVFFGGNGFAG